jgi:UDP-N-acetylmuramyl pentapeptide phosphotransferase/UDP-N-acetylglucosamine-1-phosphate transferase
MKILNIIAGIIALSYILDSFLYPDSQYDIFSIELNVWLFRIFWLIVLLGVSNDYYKISKRKKQVQESSN